MAPRVLPAQALASPFEKSSSSWKLFLQATIAIAMLADFVFRGLALAFLPVKTDFTELYASAWLWRHGLNFYDSALVTQTATRLTGCADIIAPVYPPTTVAAVAPLTYLPWGWAQFVWLLLSFIGVGATIWLLLRIANLAVPEANARLLALLVFAFGPLHQAFHLANIAVLIVPLCLLGVVLAESGRDAFAGVVLCVATMLKPQLGVWALAFYVLQVRRRLVAAAAFTAIPWVFLAVHFPVPTGDLIASYRQNVNFWFGVGKPFGFAAGAFPFNVNFAQIVLFQLWHSIVGVKVVAYAIFFLGLAVWLAAMLRSRFRAPLPLALSSLWGLSFVSLYHSVSDATILTLVLCWALPRAGRKRSWPQRLALVLCCLMLLPGHSALIRMAAHLPIAIVDAWWWKLFVARYFVWLLLMFNAMLLFALWKPDCQSQVDEVLDADPKHCRTDDNSNRTESRAEVAAFAR